MTGGQLLAFLITLAVIGVLAKMSRSGKRRWPQIACPSCDGAGWKTATRLVGLRTRKVRRPCGTCGGSPWTER